MFSPTVPLVHIKAQDIAPPRASGECKLYAAILCRALLDLTDSCQKTKNEALHWMFIDEVDRTCHVCNIDMCLEAINLSHLKTTFRKFANDIYSKKQTPEERRHYRSLITHSGTINR